MKPRYLLDTNICIYLMKHQPPEVAAHFAQCRIGEVMISAITHAELQYGVDCSPAALVDQNRAALHDFLTEVPAAPFDAAAATAYGPIRLATRQRSRDALDKLIAAHAIALGAVLVTNNVSDFAAYPGLVVENWVSS